MYNMQHQKLKCQLDYPQCKINTFFTKIWELHHNKFKKIKYYICGIVIITTINYSYWTTFGIARKRNYQKFSTLLS